jgi:hypothetical protein
LNQSLRIVTFKVEENGEMKNFAFDKEMFQSKTGFFQKFYDKQPELSKKKIELQLNFNHASFRILQDYVQSLSRISKTLA